jgi:hypothetical protein
MNETHIVIRLLRMYIQRNWEFGSALSKLRNFGGPGGLIPNPLSVRHCSVVNCVCVHVPPSAPEHLLPLVGSRCPSLAVTGARRSALRYWRVGVLEDDRLMVRGQDCGVGCGNAVFPNLWFRLRTCGISLITVWQLL